MTVSDPAVCACPCDAELAPGGPSPVFDSDLCQRRWHLHRLGLPVPAALDHTAAAKTAHDPWADVMAPAAG